MATKKLKLPKMPSVEVPLFSGRVCLTVSRADYAQAAHVFGAGHDPSLMEAIQTAQGITCQFQSETGEGVHVVGVFDAMTRTLVHELAHVAFDVLDRVGEETGSGPRETFCYLQDFLFEHFEPHLLAAIDRYAEREPEDETARMAKTLNSRPSNKVRAFYRNLAQESA